MIRTGLAPHLKMQASRLETIEVRAYLTTLDVDGI